MTVEVVKLRNKQEELLVEAVKEFHEYLLQTVLTKEFGYPPKVNLKIVREQKNSYWGQYCNRETLCKINLARAYNSTIYETLKYVAHELRHFYQYRKGMLSRSLGVDKWLNKTYKRTNGFEAYMALPWEVDAREYEERWGKLALDIFSKEVLETKLPNAKIKKKIYPWGYGYNSSEAEGELAKKLNVSRDDIHWYYAENKDPNIKLKYRRDGVCYLLQTEVERLEKTFGKGAPEIFNIAQKNFLQYQKIQPRWYYDEQGETQWVK